MKHITSDEWSEEIGETKIFLIRNGNSYRCEFELVICDSIDSHSRFHLAGDLDTAKQIALAIERLVSAASK